MDFAKYNLNYGHNIKPVLITGDSGKSLTKAQLITKYNDMVGDAAINFNAQSSGAPAIYTTAFVNEINRILFQIRNFDKVASAQTVGSFGVSQVMMPMIDGTAGLSDYDDYAIGGQSDATLKEQFRDTYEFQNTIKYGYKEQAVMGMAGIDIATEKRMMQAERFSMEFNKVGFYGVKGRNIDGLLTDRGLLPAIPGPQKFEQMNFDEALIFFGKIFNQLRVQTGGLANPDDKMTLLIDLQSAEGFSTKINLIGISLGAKLKEIYKNLEILPTPEYRNDKGIATWQLVLDNINGVKVVRSLEVSRWHSFGVIQHESSWAEKVAASTAGCVVYKPVGVVTVTNI